MSEVKRIRQFCLDTECDKMLKEIPRGERSEWIRNLMKRSKNEKTNQTEPQEQDARQNKVIKGEIIG